EIKNDQTFKKTGNLYISVERRYEHATYPSGIFKDQKVKFLWMALPNEDFTVSYKVNIDESLSGNQIIEGTFAYIQDNETEKFIIPKDIIAIQTDQADAAQEAAMAQILADQQAKEEAAEAARKEAAPEEETPVEEAAEVAEEAAAEVASEDPLVETSEAVEETAEVVEPVAESVEETSEEVVDAVEETAEVVEEAAEEVVEEVGEVVEEVAEEPVVEEAAPAQEEAPSYNDAMMKSKAGLVFRVQVAAGPNKVDPSFFKEKYGLSEDVVIEEHEGLFKYVIGEFGSYRPAKTFSNELRDSNNVEGPFVTSYNDGSRIHVKEALEIAGQ
ncbi:MAG: hypothetical protein ACPGD8_07640, partial [Flavobacteriales bacterium]